MLILSGMPARDLGGQKRQDTVLLSGIPLAIFLRL
jgi:hypothetical protein